MVGSRPATPEVSHGRGGAGNIAADDTPYVDGEVVREGPEGSHADGAFSTGRGGKQSGLFTSPQVLFLFGLLGFATVRCLLPCRRIRSQAAASTSKR